MPVHRDMKDREKAMKEGTRPTSSESVQHACPQGYEGQRESDERRNEVHELRVSSACLSTGI
jgi:hypothetical protein